MLGSIRTCHDQWQRSSSEESCVWLTSLLEMYLFGESEQAHAYTTLLCIFISYMYVVP